MSTTPIPNHQTHVNVIENGRLVWKPKGYLEELRRLDEEKQAMKAQEEADRIAELQRIEDEKLLQFQKPEKNSGSEGSSPLQESSEEVGPEQESQQEAYSEELQSGFPDGMAEEFGPGPQSDDSESKADF